VDVDAAPDLTHLHALTAPLGTGARADLAVGLTILRRCEQARSPTRHERFHMRAGA
jgi:hypothetical protein